ncbi:MAG: hypothetical protein K2X61_08895 [Caulobacteraceae bacterium]|nr:hypothetical protein [Caulobacteraceae bacterium]
MNKQRRQMLWAAVELLNQAESIIEDVKEQEQAACDNLPENLQNSAQAEAMHDIALTLDELSDRFDEIRAALNPVLNP